MCRNGCSLCGRTVALHVFMRNNSDTGVNHHFSGKTVQRWGTINEKQKKEAFVEVRLMKNAENKASYPYDERKTRKITLRRDTTNKETAKNSFPSRGKTRIQRKSAFPYEGKQENSENQLSLMGENKKSAKNGFPPRGKTKNQRKILSQDWEDEKMWKIGFPKLGKNKKRKKMAVPTLGRPKNGEKMLSQTWEE